MRADYNYPYCLVDEAGRRRPVPFEARRAEPMRAYLDLAVQRNINAKDAAFVVWPDPFEIEEWEDDEYAFEGFDFSCLLFTLRIGARELYFIGIVIAAIFIFGR